MTWWLVTWLVSDQPYQYRWALFDDRVMARRWYEQCGAPYAYFQAVGADQFNEKMAFLLANS